MADTDQTSPTATQPSDDDVAAIDALRNKAQSMRQELAKAIHGQEDVIEDLLICIFSQGHALLMGVPGLAKTLLIHSLSEVMSLSFSRIQFTPDLMPADIIGTDILQETDTPGRRAFEFNKGPIFANIVLADEINRTPPKTQAALLQAMQEKHISVVGRTFDMETPFFVLATQNPIEQEGTYPLPEAQLDRFMFFISVDYPTRDDEIAIARTTTGVDREDLEHIISAEELLSYQKLIRRVPVPDHIYEYVVDLVRSLRPGDEGSPEWVQHYVSWGPGPRAVQNLILGAKARSVLQGSYFVRQEDVNAIMKVTLRHRINLNFHAESEGVSADDIINRLLEEQTAKA